MIIFHSSLGRAGLRFFLHVIIKIVFVFFLRIKAVWAKKSWYTNWIFAVLVRKEKKMFILYYNIVLFCFHLLLGHFHEVVVLWDLMGRLLWVIFLQWPRIFH